MLDADLPALSHSIVTLVCSRYYSERSIHDPGSTNAPVIVGGDNPQCVVPDVQRKVAAFMLAISMVAGILSAFTAPKIGAWSDRYGRLRMMIITSSGGVLSEIIVVLAATYPDLVHYTWLLVGSALDGLAGSFIAASVLSHSYTSDCTPPSRRSVAIGYLHAALFVGLAGGPLVAGYFVEWTGTLVSVFYVMLGSHVAFILASAFVIPESLSLRRQLIARDKYAHEIKRAVSTGQADDRRDESQLPSSWLSAVLRAGVAHVRRLGRSFAATNPLAPLKILYPRGSSPSTVRLRRNLLTLALVDTIIMGFAMSAGTVILLYTEYMFGWGNLEGSMLMSFMSLVRVFVLTVLLPGINYMFRIRPAARRRHRQGLVQDVNRINVSGSEEKNAGADEVDIWILRVALVTDVVSMVGYGLARSQEVFVMMAAVASFGGLGSATIQAALTKHMPTERVGQLLGAIALLHALSRVVAPMLFNGLYALTVVSFPQAIFVLLSCMFATALAASLLVRPHGKTLRTTSPSFFPVSCFGTALLTTPGLFT